jgi:hypothetical protein
MQAMAAMPAMNTEKSSMNTGKSSNMDIRSKSPDMGMNMSFMSTKKSSNMGTGKSSYMGMNMPAKKTTPWSSEMLVSSMKRTGLSETITNKFYTTFNRFPQDLVTESHVPEYNSTGPVLRSWGNDDWVQFVNEYTIMSDGSIDMAALKDLQRSLSFLPNADGPGSRGAKAGQVTRNEMSGRYEDAMAKKQAIAMLKAGQSDDNGGSGRYEEGMAMQSKDAAKAAAKYEKEQAMAALKAGSAMSWGQKGMAAYNAPMGVPPTGMTISGMQKMAARAGQSDDNGGSAMSWGQKGVTKQAKSAGYASNGYGNKNTRSIKSSEKQALAPPVDVTPILNVLAKINTTLKNSLTSIEGTAKKNDIKPSLEEMNDNLLAIMASIPSQAGGGKSKSSKQKASEKAKKDKKAKEAAAKAKKTEIPQGDSIPVSSDSNINKVVESLNIINNTFSSTLAAIDSRLKNNDVNAALATMNEYLSEISTSMPEQGGGGTRRLRVKKGKKALRNRGT